MNKLAPPPTLLCGCVGCCFCVFSLRVSSFLKKRFLTLACSSLLAMSSEVFSSHAHRRDVSWRHEWLAKTSQNFASKLLKSISIEEREKGRGRRGLLRCCFRLERPTEVKLFIPGKELKIRSPQQTESFPTRNEPKGDENSQANTSPLPIEITSQPEKVGGHKIFPMWVCNRTNEREKTYRGKINTFPLVHFSRESTEGRGEHNAKWAEGSGEEDEQRRSSKRAAAGVEFSQYRRGPPRCCLAGAAGVGAGAARNRASLVVDASVC